MDPIRFSERKLNCAKSNDFISNKYYRASAETPKKTKTSTSISFEWYYLHTHINSGHAEMQYFEK